MFSSDQVARLTGCTYRQLDYWNRAGLVVPVDGEGTPGSGAQRRYDITELFVVCVVAELMRLRAGAEVAGRAAEWLRMGGLATRGLVFVDGEGFIVAEPSTSAYVVDLDAIRARLDERAADLAAA